jgi:formamidopyrimidine-DNA glycosylase
MPEMPEVETIARKLRRSLVGRSVNEVRLSGLSLRRPVAGSFTGILPGRRISKVSRRGKYLVFELEPRAYLLIHLGMSGRVFHRFRAEEPSRHTHAVISLSDGSVLEYRDPRRFGLLVAYDVRQMREIPELRRLGKDPLSGSFDREWLWPSISRSRCDIKSFLLDQRRIAGLGNIYVCEALFRARIHPARRCNRLSREEVGSLVRSIRRVLRTAIRNRGTTFSDFMASDGAPGRNQHCLRVFQREGRKCRRCSTVIRRLRQGNRSSYYCPGCQRLS